MVLFTSDTFPDLEKTLAADCFLDLTGLMQADGAFVKEDYLPGLFDCGVRGEKCLFLPLSFRGTVVLSDSAQLKQAGISLSAHPDFREWADAVMEYAQTHSAAENRRLFDPSNLNFADFLNWSGLSVTDTSTNTVFTNTEAFEHFMRLWKTVYPLTQQGEETLYYNGATKEKIESIRNGDPLFFLVSSYDVLTSNRITDTVFSFPSYRDGEAIARPLMCAAINRNSGNVDEAWAYIKALLSLTQQIDPYLDAPVQVQALTRSIGEENTAALTGEDNTSPLLPVRCNPAGQAMYELVYTAMQPWFEDNKSYDACIAELNNTLELYLYE